MDSLTLPFIQSASVAFDKFLLVLVRVGGVLMITPFFGSRNIPATVKIGLTILVSFLVAPSVRGGVSLSTTHPYAYAAALSGEMLVGVIFGFLILLAFSVFQMAGQQVEVPMGFGMMNVLDPQMGQQIPLLGQFQYILATLLFMSMNGHHYLLRALARSFELLPLGKWFYQPPMTEAVVKVFGQMFALAFQISLPVVATLVLTDIVLGIIARTVPQLNVFVIGFSVKIIIGLLALMVALPLYVSAVENLFGPASDLFSLLYRFWGAGN